MGSEEETQGNEGGEDMHQEEEKEEGRIIQVMKPWEQHAGVISIPRFDYNAPSALFHHSHSGFLITCSIKREKSATKEAMSILEKYVGFDNSHSDDSLGRSDADSDSKRRKISTSETSVCVEDLKSQSFTGAREDVCQSSAMTDTTEQKSYGLSLVKLTKSGLLFLAFLGKFSPDTVDIVSNIFQSLESGKLKSPQWCHRILPVQATCQLNENELRAVVSKLVLQFVNDKRNKLSRPIKFAIGYNRRGIEEMQSKTAKGASKDISVLPLLDRSKCFDVVASAVNDAISDSVVDLKCPELSVLVELLPVSGMPNGSLVAAVSVLPQNLVTVKPRLCVRALVTDVNARNVRN